ncbi:MAG: hypothetical protein LBS62_06205, partial [Clostridiales bacterium]|nr:hypothetical protein [Clostridiales bacterium]
GQRPAKGTPQGRKNSGEKKRVRPAAFRFQKKKIACGLAAILLSYSYKKQTIYSEVIVNGIGNNKRNVREGV